MAAMDGGSHTVFGYEMDMLNGFSFSLSEIVIGFKQIHKQKAFDKKPKPVDDCLLSNTFCVCIRLWYQSPLLS